MQPNTMQPVVCKFGGTSLASAQQIQKVADILHANSARTAVIPSAPGKRFKKDQKITDLLYLCHEHASRGLPFTEVFSIIRARFQEIVEALKIKLDINSLLDQVEINIAKQGELGNNADYAASRGEFINGHIIAVLLGWQFIDAADVIHFTEKGMLDPQKTYDAVAARIGQTPSVIPGFYGSLPNGTIKTFSRGGSDITGAIVARAIQASVYENWTDVHGLLITDPNIVPDAFTIETITYQELRELSYSGAKVLHEDAVFPVREANIPVNIRNTNDPSEPGTKIVPAEHPTANISYRVTGIAGRKDFTVILIEKAMMNAELGFCRRVLSVLEEHRVSFEHLPSGIDTLSVVVQDSELEDGVLPRLLDGIRASVNPDRIEIQQDMALIATVGRGIAGDPMLTTQLFQSFCESNIRIRMIDQGSSLLNIITGVDAKDFEAAVRCIYRTFIHDGDQPMPLHS